ncbi:MAG: DUF1415 domain-containing protein [Bacteriovorax sp.]|nr:DUF1415 domain-containing protein [Bacteriovorax sp.]
MHKIISSRELSIYWLEKIVIGLDLCPFARQPYNNGLVRLVENEAVSESDQLSFFLDELEHLQQTSPTELSTTLITFIKDESDFFDFNDFVGLCEDMLVESGLEEHFQLIVFHPQFIFEEKDPLHRAHWVGRSPFPTLHILRNAEIEMALASYSDLIGIPARNEGRLLSLSNEEFEKIFYYLK